VLALGANQTRPDYDYAKQVTLYIARFEDGVTTKISVPTIDGKVALTATVSRHGRLIYVQVEGSTKPWQVLVGGVSNLNLTLVEGGTAQAVKRGTQVIPEVGHNCITLHLPESRTAS
jgi:alpha-D-xyloside xylohydrolase